MEKINMGLSQKKRKILEEMSHRERIALRDFYDECFNSYKKYLYDNDLSRDETDYELTILDEETGEEKEVLFYGKQFWDLCLDILAAIRELNEKND